MARELSFVLINPYTIAKSRTGGVIARFIARTGLELVAARMYGPSIEMARRYSDLVRKADSRNPEMCGLIADYIMNNYAPDPLTGKPRRVMLLLFEGEDAVSKVWTATGSATLRWGSGETIRDTYGDYIVGKDGGVQYFEPAVLVGPTKQRTAATLSLWAEYALTDGGIIESAIDVPVGGSVEKTLVLIKPDSFRFHSARPGNIIDLLSLSGLRIVAVKKFSMTVAQAEEFYGPVREALKRRFMESDSARAADALRREFGFDIPQAAVETLSAQIAPVHAEEQFDRIVKYMTGYSRAECSESENRVLGKEECLALVYEGADGVKKIRSILGATDPDKAQPGSVRREFGSNVMLNAAHASDSAESAKREMRIIGVEEDTVRIWVERYYGKSASVDPSSGPGG